MKNSTKCSTWKNYKKLVNNYITEFGEINLSELNSSDIKKWVRKQNCTLKTLNNKISPLRCALKDAVYDNYIDNNF